MKKSQKLAALMVMFGMFALVTAPQAGPWPFPDDSAGGNIVSNS